MISSVEWRKILAIGGEKTMPKSTKGWGAVMGYRIRNSSFARESWSLKDLGQNPGTKEKPKYVHADSITIKGTTVTLVANGKTFTSDEVKFNNIAKQYGLEDHVKPISCYYFDVKDGSTGRYLRVWVTEKEMHNALFG